MKILRPEVEEGLVGGGGLYDLFDNVVKVLFNITDKEYDFIAENSTDAEMDIFVSSLGTMEKGSTFAERRKALELRNEKLTLFNLKKDE
jgi:hypothetical protein